MNLLGASIFLLLAGCGVKPTPVTDAGVDAGPPVPTLDAGFLTNPTITGVHVATCEDPGCGNGFNPPLGGNHCPTWLPCRKYDQPQQRCQWIHNLEHGHAVLAYNCPEGCPEIVTELNALWQSLQANPTRKRILVTPDPNLPYKVAAIVWGFGWQGDTFDAAAINDVLSHQDEQAPESGFSCAE